MKILLDVLGFRYEDGWPAFVKIKPNYYYHIHTKRFFDRDSLDTRLANAGKSFAAGEVGIPPQWWVDDNGDIFDSIDSGGAHPPPGTNAFDSGFDLGFGA